MLAIQDTSLSGTIHWVNIKGGKVSRGEKGMGEGDEIGVDMQSFSGAVAMAYFRVLIRRVIDKDGRIREALSQKKK